MNVHLEGQAEGAFNPKEPLDWWTHLPSNVICSARSVDLKLSRLHRRLIEFIEARSKSGRSRVRRSSYFRINWERSARARPRFPFSMRLVMNWVSFSSSTLSWRQAVFWIHYILVWIRIRIRGSMPLTTGSGSGFGSYYFRHWPIFAYYFLKKHVHHFSKIKVQKK